MAAHVSQDSAAAEGDTLNRQISHTEDNSFMNRRNVSGKSVTAIFNYFYRLFSEFNDSVVSTTDNLTSQLEAGRITEVRNEQRRVRTSSDSQRDPTRQNSIQPSTTALNTAVTFTNRPVITDTNHVSGTNSYHH